MVTPPPGRRGASSLGCLVKLALFAVAVYYGVHIGGVYFRFYQLQDDMEQQGPLVDPDDEHIDPEAELPAEQQGDDTPLFGQETAHKPSPEEARQLFAAALAEFEQKGQMVVGPKDFNDWCDRNNLSRPWVSARHKEAYLEGRLKETGHIGRWRIVPALTPA